MNLNVKGGKLMHLTADEKHCYIKPCPNCGKINISYGTKEGNKPSCRNLYKCHNCNNKYWDYKYFMNTVNGILVNAYKEPLVTVKSKKTGKSYIGIDLDSKSYLIEKKPNEFVCVSKSLFI